ncbi:hypothetical protein J4G43_015135 [Bradyrhizobium barranii subsp. barranii]|uniref:Uncharacterized protein n=1 Tax=Bradyrhizobium barranii subsp. barranii TaxID=2823807 RepID=A0A939S3J5_9BRAD|nr:hypothetical protein [Bradyrhizobium barranii]UEM15423.1 hypothetical protein J4G43_015135 [Bradyrhizobium barranii subsp. barranii]
MSLLWKAGGNIRSDLYSGFRLNPVDPSERAALALEPGTNHVLIAWRKKGGRPFAYDTAQIETLFIELPELPAPTDYWAELGWTKLGIQNGNLALFFASITATGRIEARWGRDFLTLLLHRRRADIRVDAHFTDPFIGGAHTPTVEIHWTFSVNLQASAVPASHPTASLAD